MVSMNVPFRSEDANIPLRARMYLDLVPGLARGLPQAEQDLSPGVLQDADRSVLMEWAAPGSGCHTMTMILTYVNNFDPITLLPTDDALAAHVTWWLNINDVDNDVIVASCPRSEDRDVSIP